MLIQLQAEELLPEQEAEAENPVCHLLVQGAGREACGNHSADDVF